VQDSAKTDLRATAKAAKIVAAFDDLILGVFNAWPEHSVAAIDFMECIQAAWTSFIGSLWQASVLSNAHYATLNAPAANLYSLLLEAINSEVRLLQVAASIHRGQLRQGNDNHAPVLSDFLRQSLLAVRGLAAFPDQQTQEQDSNADQTAD